MRAGVPGTLWEETYHETVRRNQDFAPLQAQLQWNTRAIGAALAGYLSLLIISAGCIIDDAASFVIWVATVVSVGALPWLCLRARRKIIHERYIARILECKQFVEEQRARYRKHGVRANMITWKPLGSVMGPKLIVGGIMFTVVQKDARKGDSSKAMVEDLTALAGMRDSGAITKKEFQAAKTKIWKDYGIGPTTYGSTDDEAPALAIAQVVAAEIVEPVRSWGFGAQVGLDLDSIACDNDVRTGRGG